MRPIKLIDIQPGQPFHLFDSPGDRRWFVDTDRNESRIKLADRVWITNKDPQPENSIITHFHEYTTMWIQIEDDEEVIP